MNDGVRIHQCVSIIHNLVLENIEICPVKVHEFYLALPAWTLIIDDILFVW